MIPISIFEFLSDLKIDNSREWFAKNKNRYDIAKSDFEHYVSQLILKVNGIDSTVGNVEAKDCIFRIFRDVRFSKDKSPYKPNFGAYICAGGRKSELPGYYIHIEPGASFAGGGLYVPQPNVLNAVRNEIANSSEEFKAIILKPKFKKIFPQIYGEKLKMAPKGFEKNHPDIELLKFKSYTFVASLSDSDLFEPDFENKLEAIYTELSAVNSFLLRAF